MDLRTLLSQEEKRTFKDFIETPTCIKVDDVDQVLTYWDKNKKRLCKLLGNKLRMRIPITVTRNKQMFYRQLAEIYEIPWQMSQIENVKIAEFEKYNFEPMVHNKYVYDIAEYACKYFFNNRIDRSAFLSLFDYCMIENGLVHYHNPNSAYTFDSLGVTIKNGTRIMRAIQKMLKLMKYPRMENFEHFRNQISDISNNKDRKVNLVLSIHPLDIMTLSDNHSRWSSCLSWLESGAYHQGVINMLTSNNVMVAYLESEHTPTFFGCIPNKTWRVLVYITKPMILIGKSYPYEELKLNEKLLEIVRGLVKDKFSWNYKYTNQYMDHLNFPDDYDIDTYVYDTYRYSHKNLVLLHGNKEKSGRIYNDIAFDHDYPYICCKNDPGKTKFISISGPFICLKDGMKLDHGGCSEDCQICWRKSQWS